MFILIFPIHLLVGQSHTRFNNYWDNTYSINPASINDAYFGSLTMGMRKQWVSFPGSPTTLLGMGTLYFEDLSTQIGVKIMQEKKGYTSSMDIDFSYAYSFLLNNDWKMNLGLAISYQNHSYDLSKQVFSTTENEGIYDKFISTNNINTDFGFELNYRSLKMGASSQNLNSLLNPQNELHLNTNIAYVFYKKLDNDFINYGVGVSAFQYSNMYQMEFNISTFIKKDWESKPIQIGVFYRTWREVGLIFGVELDNFKVSYSYDYNFGRILNHSFGSHEIMLTYNFDKIFKCRTCW